MKKFNFGKKSIEALNTCHKDLQTIFNEAIKITSIDFGISEGHRTIAKQYEYYKEGKSLIDGVKQKGKHNYFPSLAVDIYPFIDGKANYDKESLSYLAGLIHGVSEILFQQFEIEHKIRWGGNWDMDGIILIDQSFDDRPHFELVKTLTT